MFQLNPKSSDSTFQRAFDMNGHGIMSCTVMDDSLLGVGAEFHTHYMFTTTSKRNVRENVSIIGDVTPSDIERLHNQLMMHLDNGIEFYKAVILEIADTGMDFDFVLETRMDGDTREVYMRYRQTGLIK